MRHKSRLTQIEAMSLMVGIVRTDVKNLADQEATLDYIHATIDSW
jgi:hypothetical protein